MLRGPRPSRLDEHTRRASKSAEQWEWYTQLSPSRGEERKGGKTRTHTPASSCSVFLRQHSGSGARAARERRCIRSSSSFRRIHGGCFTAGKLTTSASGRRGVEGRRRRRGDVNIALPCFVHHFFYCCCSGAGQRSLFWAGWGKHHAAVEGKYFGEVVFGIAGSAAAAHPVSLYLCIADSLYLCISVCPVSPWLCCVPALRPCCGLHSQTFSPLELHLPGLSSSQWPETTTNAACPFLVYGESFCLLRKCGNKDSNDWLLTVKLFDLFSFSHDRLILMEWTHSEISRFWKWIKIQCFWFSVSSNQFLGPKVFRTNRGNMAVLHHFIFFKHPI